MRKGEEPRNLKVARTLLGWGKGLKRVVISSGRSWGGQEKGVTIRRILPTALTYHVILANDKEEGSGIRTGA